MRKIKNLTNYGAGKMEMSEIISYAITLISGGAITSLFNLKWSRKQAKSDAETSEAAARQATTEVTKSVQDVYQELTDDLKKTISEQRDEINELRGEDRENKKNIKTLHSNQTKMEITIQNLEKRLAALLPFLCAVEGCKKRQAMICPTLDGLHNKNEDEE